MAWTISQLRSSGSRVESSSARIGRDPVSDVAKSAQPAYKTETWAKTRALVWARPGQSGRMMDAANWLEDVQLSAVGVVLPLAQTNMRLGFSTRLLYSGGLKGYDDALAVVSEESYYDLGFTTSISRNFDKIGLSLGAGVTFIREHLIPTDGNGYSFSFGATYRRQQNSFQNNQKKFY